MDVDSDLLRSARKGRREAIIELLALHYPIVWRMAGGLTGRPDVGRGVVKFIMPRSIRAMASWNNGSDPSRWFYHHTLLTTRRTMKHAPDPGTDTLLAGSTDPAYVAFIRSLRGLPMQQREAFILAHGERLETRRLAVAMDCSMTAAANHLREAGEQLQRLSPDLFEKHIAQLNTAYEQLSPDEELAIRNDVNRLVRPYFWKRTIKIILRLGLLALVLWASWWIWQIVQKSLPA